MQSTQTAEMIEAEKKLHKRISSAFYRILLVSPTDTQTVALVPDQYFANDITRLLTEHIRIRADQRFVCKKDKLRPEKDGSTETLNWGSHNRGE